MAARPMGRYPLDSESDPALLNTTPWTREALDIALGLLLIALAASLTGNILLAIKYRDSRVDLGICLEGAKALKENRNAP